MNKITATDTIFATVQHHGTTCLNTRMTGMGSVKEVLEYIYNIMKDMAGLITIRLRNASEGWTSRHDVMLRRAAVVPSVAPAPVTSGYPSLFADQGL